MYKSLITIVLLTFSSLTFASPKEIAQLYTEFNKQKNELLKSDLNKKNIKDKLNPIYKNLSESLEAIKAIESKSKNDLLTPEGNEMAYELEILEPLKMLATGLISKEDCLKAEHEHQLNFPVVEDDESKTIKNIIQKICD